MPSGAWENLAGGTAFSDRGEYAAGPRSQSAASAFLPSRGADPGKTPRCGGRGAEIRGQVVRPPPQTIAPWAQLSSGGQNWRGNGLQITHLIGFICNPEGLELRLECCLLD